MKERRTRKKIKKSKNQKKEIIKELNIILIRHAIKTRMINEGETGRGDAEIHKI